MLSIDRRAAIACLGLGLVIWLPPLWAELTRAAALALVVVASIAVAGGANRLMAASPLFLLGILAMIFYVLVPSLLAPLYIGRAEGNAQYDAYISHFMGSPAESLILRFAALLLCLAAILPQSPPRAGRLPRVGGGLGAVLTLAAAGMAGLVRAHPVGTEFPDLVAVTPALLAFGLMLQAFRVERGDRRGLTLLGVTFVLGMAASLLAGYGKPTVLTALVLLMVLAGRLRLRLRQLVPDITAAGVLAVAAMVLVLPPHPVKGGGLARFGHEMATVVQYKLWVRQVQTVACFASALEQHDGTEPETGPAYFLSSLVPRAVWPDKPRVPDGAGYAQRYCGIPYVMPIHSSAVTLLGEPVIKAGRPGLLVAGGVLLAGLAGLSLALTRLGPVGAAWIAAITPWLMDFDQHFAMYLANAAKCALAMAPLALLAMGLERWLTPSSSAGAAAGPPAPPA